MIYLKVQLVILVVQFSKKIISYFCSQGQKGICGTRKVFKHGSKKTRITGKSRRERRRWVRVTTVDEEKEDLYCEEVRCHSEKDERCSEKEERCDKEEWSRGEEEEGQRWYPWWVFVKSKQVDLELRERNRISTEPSTRSFLGTINGFSISAYL